MDSSVSILTSFVTPWNQPSQKKNSMMQKQTTNVPKNFIWSLSDDINQPKKKLDAPIIDLEGFIRGDETATKKASEALKEACANHGFFQVINHGVYPKLLNEAYNNIGQFFSLPPSEKAKVVKMRGSLWGLSVAHADRLTTNLPWKETLSFPHRTKSDGDSVVDYFTSALGNEFEPMGTVYKNYCNEMQKLSLVILELMAISLGVERSYYRDFYKDANSIMRLNHYPPCEEPSLVLGTGPHCDPTSLTLLYQNEIEGLEVFVNNEWHLVEPRNDALVINIGDTLMAMTNGEYKSCLHRAIVNEKVARNTMAFFLCPADHKVVTPPSEILENKQRKYPDFTWADVVEFTQKHYRADANTLDAFTNWFWSNASSKENDAKLENVEN
ncbi:gibberellin 20 oxidase 1-like [Chenopodium quinoa]|nr:gibberellin 20 oxidase 1-like [Chenopodium quinoa]